MMVTDGASERARKGEMIHDATAGRREMNTQLTSHLANCLVVYNDELPKLRNESASLG